MKTKKIKHSPCKNCRYPCTPVDLDKGLCVHCFNMKKKTANKILNDVCQMTIGIKGITICLGDLPTVQKLVYEYGVTLK